MPNKKTRGAAIFVPKKCLKCKAETDPANVHFTSEMEATYECLECGSEYPIEMQRIP